MRLDWGGVTEPMGRGGASLRATTCRQRTMRRQRSLREMAAFLAEIAFGAGAIQLLPQIRAGIVLGGIEQNACWPAASIPV